MATPLCLWRPGDSITAHRLNEMTTTLNDAAKQAEALASELNSITSASTSTIGGLPSARVISTGKGQFMEQNRGVILDQWDFHIDSGDKCGIYVRCSGFENATGVSYPAAPCIAKIASYNEAINGDELMQTIYTDCWGNVKCSKIELLRCVPGDTKMWSGPVDVAPSDPSSPDSNNAFKFYRRLGRIVDSCIEFSCGSIALRKVMETNDVVMPILPVRAEKESTNNGVKSHSLVGDFVGNSVLIKNIQNGGGIKSQSLQSGVKLQSGIQVVKGCVAESDSSTGEPSISWPEAPQGPEPQPYDVVAMCIPVKEQKYKWNKETQNWEKPTVEGSCGSAAGGGEIKSYVKLHAKSIGDKNWVLGLVGSGEIEIPVKDFTPGEGVEYEAGRGINISEQQVPSSDPNSTETTTKNVICNTMTITQGCLVSVTEPKPGEYKISACKTKVEAGDGICVSEIQGGWKVTAKDPCIKITGGEGINVTGGPKCWTISNTTTYVPTEVVAGNGICVVQTGNKYKVSIKPPCSTCCVCICGVKYSFDPAWFTVTNNTVTINEAKINQVAEGIAPNVSSSITTTATAAIDTYSDVSVRCDMVTGRFGGDVMATVNTTSGETATASFSTRETWRN